MKLYLLTTISSDNKEVEISPLFVSEHEANDYMNKVYNKLCSKAASCLSLDTANSSCKTKSFRVVMGDRWVEGNITELESPFKSPISCPQTVIFDGKNSEEVQEKANVFFLKHPNIEIIDTELSANLETTSVEHYFRITYAIIYKSKEDKNESYSDFR